MTDNLLFRMTWAAFEAVTIPCLVLSALCAVFLIIVVMMQKSNSSGISAIGGQQETFYGKNKGKTLEHKLRKLTVITVCIMAALMIVFSIVVFNAEF